MVVVGWPHIISWGVVVGQKNIKTSPVRPRVWPLDGFVLHAIIRMVFTIYYNILYIYIYYVYCCRYHIIHGTTTDACTHISTKTSPMGTNVVYLTAINMIFLIGIRYTLKTECLLGSEDRDLRAKYHWLSD